MVCRENKSRSSSMGYAKALMRQAGFCDAEIQSMLHQVKHDGDAIDKEAPFTREQQIDFVEHQIAAISADPRISDADKYRESVQRPGLVTRLEQELKRLKTGKDEHGNKLRPEQINNASHQYAIERMQEQLERMLPARQTFLETNARHRGISYEQAQAEWNELMNRKGHFEGQSMVNEKTRESLATAGIDEKTQVTLGVSGRAINTMEIMEKRRQDAVARLEHTPTFNKKTRQTTPKQPGKGYIQCGICGQFGHEDDECPNVDLAKRRDDMLGSIAQLNHQDDVDYALGWGDYIDEMKAKWNTDNIEDVSGPWDGDLAEVRAIARNEGKTVGDFIQSAKSEKKRLDANGEWDDAEKRARLRASSERYVTEAINKINATGEHYNATIRSVDYSPDTLALKIEHVDRDGNKLPARMYRCDAMEAAQVTAMANNGADMDTIVSTVLRKNSNMFASTQDALAATTITRCPTCGQFTSLTADHQCVVKGGPSEGLELERRRQRMAERRAQREKYNNLLKHNQQGMKVRTYQEELVVKGNRGSKMWQIPGAGPDEPKRVRATFDIPDSDALKGSASKAKAAVAPVSIVFSGRDPNDAGGVVTGKVTLWDMNIKNRNGQNETRHVLSTSNTGLAVEEDFHGNMKSTTGLKCTCAAYKKNGTCVHIRTARVRLQSKYNALYAPDGMIPGDVFPGGRTFAPDMQVKNNARQSVNALSMTKNARITDQLERQRQLRSASVTTTKLMVEGPTHPDGTPAEWPTTFMLQPTNDDGSQRKQSVVQIETDVRNTGAVTERARHLLSSEYVTWADGTKERVRYSVSKARGRDGIVVNIPKKFRNASIGRQMKVRQALAERLGMPKSVITSDGIYFANDPATYYEFLERAADNGKSVRIFGPRAVAKPTKETKGTV